MGMSVQERLFALKDEDFARFQSALIPNIPKETVVGVRMPMIRKLAKEIAGEAETQAFLTELPHAYYDENVSPWQAELHTDTPRPGSAEHGLTERCRTEQFYL